MFCKNCGRQLPDDAAFCHECGAKRPDGAAQTDERSSADIRNLPSYAKEIDRSDHAVDSDRKKFSLSDPDRKKFSLSDSGRNKFSLSDSGRDKFSLSDKSRKDDAGGIVRLTSSRERPAPTKEPVAPPKEQVVPPKEPASPQKEPAGFVNPLKDSGGTIFRSGDTSNVHASEPAKTSTAASPATSTQKDPPAANPATSARSEQTAPREPDAPPEETYDGPCGFVNPLKGTGDDIRWGSDGDRNQPAEDVGEIESPHLKFATIMVILSCTCCNPVTLVLGIIAIVFAFQVATCSRSGNLGIALQKAAVARVLCWITFGLLAAWIAFWVAMLCLPMPEDHTEKDVIKENQTEQVEEENAEKPAKQADGESATQEIQTEQADGENIESTEPDIHHGPLNLLLDILD